MKNGTLLVRFFQFPLSSESKSWTRYHFTVASLCLHRVCGGGGKSVYPVCASIGCVCGGKRAYPVCASIGCVWGGQTCISSLCLHRVCGGGQTCVSSWGRCVWGPCRAMQGPWATERASGPRIRVLRMLMLMLILMSSGHARVRVYPPAAMLVLGFTPPYTLQDCSPDQP